MTGTELDLSFTLSDSGSNSVQRNTVCSDRELIFQSSETSLQQANPVTLQPEISLTNTRTDLSLYLKLHYLWQESGLNNIIGPQKTTFRKMENIQYITKIQSYHLQVPHCHFYSAVSINVASPQHIRPPQASLDKEQES